MTAKTASISGTHLRWREDQPAVNMTGTPRHFLSAIDGLCLKPITRSTSVHQNRVAGTAGAWRRLLFPPGQPSFRQPLKILRPDDHAAMKVFSRRRDNVLDATIMPIIPLCSPEIDCPNDMSADNDGWLVKMSSGFERHFSGSGALKDSAELDPLISHQPISSAVSTGR